MDKSKGNGGGASSTGGKPESKPHGAGEEALKKAKEEANQNYDKYLRARADLDNYRKQAAREREELLRLQMESLFREILPVVDHLELALGHALRQGSGQALRPFDGSTSLTAGSAQGRPFDTACAEPSRSTQDTLRSGQARPASEDPASLAGVIEGVELVLKQLHTFLSRHGIKPIEAIGQPFDPKVHEAIAHRPSAEAPPNTILEEHQKGYWMHHHVLRPSRVTVST